MRLNKTSLSEQRLKEIFKIDETNKVLSDFVFDYLYNAKDPAPFRNFIFQKIKKKLC